MQKCPDSIRLLIITNTDRSHGVELVHVTMMRLVSHCSDVPTPSVGLHAQSSERTPSGFACLSRHGKAGRASKSIVRRDQEGLLLGGTRARVTLLIISITRGLENDTETGSAGAIVASQSANQIDCERRLCIETTNQPGNVIDPGRASQVNSIAHCPLPASCNPALSSITSLAHLTSRLHPAPPAHHPFLSSQFLKPCFLHH